MEMTLPLAQVSCRVRCGPQRVDKFQALVRPGRIAGLVESRWDKAAGPNLLREDWESHDETFAFSYGDDAAYCSGRPQLENKFQASKA